MSYHEEESPGSESDDGFEEDMAALRKACSVTGVDDSVNDLPKSSTAYIDYDATYASEEEDMELLRNIQKRFSVPTNDLDSEELAMSMKPLNIILPSGLSDDNDDYGDDFETLRAIQRRFSQYNDNMDTNMESFVQKSEQVGATNIELEKESSPNFFVKRINNGQGFPDCVDGSTTNQNLDFSSNSTPDTPNVNVSEGQEPGSEITPVPDCGFPRSAQAFVEAIKKNRICQKFIRSKLVEVEARMEESKKLRERVKILKDFQLACRKKTGRALSQKKDPRIQLISIPKQRANAGKDKETNAIYQGPAENPDVANYKDAMSNYPFALTKDPWSKEEKKNLLKGIKQQFQERLMQNVFSSEDADSYHLDNMIAKIRDHEISPEEIRSFLPKVNWEHLASMYLKGRSGPECQSRWMNCEDPLINHESWSSTEEKKLLYTVEKLGYCNWNDISETLGTNRTPFQCLSRFQRSLNASIIKNEWTPPEDEELRNAVAEYGETNWQLVASTLEGRTGTQCSNRWKKSLNPLRERVGKWASDEDKRLKIAVKLFGAKNWNKIARFVPGRTQVQCRERWVNCLDPALNMNEWTEEEDLKLKYAIEEHGYCWSRIADCIPPRTDSQCRRRWKVLLPHEVPRLQAARKMKRAALISNFVDREDERPALTINDFMPPLRIDPPLQPNKEKQRGALKIRSRRARTVTHTEKVLKLIDEDDDHADISNSRSKNKPTISSQDTGLSDLNNSEGTTNRNNSEIKKKATGKRKRNQRGKKEHKINETMEPDATLNQRTTRPRSRAKRGCRVVSVHVAESETQDAPIEVVITGIENASKNKPNVSSENTGLLVYKRRRKQTCNKEHEKPDETLEPDAIINQNTTNPPLRSNRGCHLASVHVAESEPQDAPISDPGVSHDNGATLTTGSEGMELLYLNNGEGAERFDGDNSDIKKKATGKRKRKQRGNQKADETLEPDYVLSQKTTKPRSRSNRGHRLSPVHVAESEPQDAPISDPCVSHDNGTISIVGIENGSKKKAIGKSKSKRRGNKEVEINDAILNQKTTKPHSRSNRGCCLASVHVAESEPQDDDPSILTTERTAINTTESREVAVTGVENGSKNNPNMSSEDTGLLVLNNGEGAGTVRGDNSEIKSKATGKRKRKQRGTKEHEKPDETLDPDAILNQTTTKPIPGSNRGCLTSVRVAECEPHDPPIGDPGVSHDHGAILTTENTVIDTNEHPEVAILGIKDELKNKPKRKRRGSKEHEKTDGKTLIDPPMMEAPLEAAIIGTGTAMSANEFCKKRRVSVNRGGKCKNGEKRGMKRCAKIAKMADEETVGSFFGRLKKKRRLDL